MYGRYTFELRTKNGDLINPEKKSISFQVARPWYFSNFMFINYSLFAGLILFFTNRYTRRYYVWKEKRLEKINRRKLEIKEIERKKNIASIENEKLQQGIVLEGFMENEPYHRNQQFLHIKMLHQQ